MHIYISYAFISPAALLISMPAPPRPHCSTLGSLSPEKVNCFNVRPFARPPEAVQLVKTKHVRRHYGSLCLIKTPQPSNIRILATGRHRDLCERSLVNVFLQLFFFVPHCPLQAKYWNSSVNEVEGTITDNKGKVIHKLFGKWHEAVFCGTPPSATCIWRASTILFALKKSLFIYDPFFSDMSSSVWRAGAMPVDHEQYYGFTKFAIELNELEPSVKLLLPPTDTRLRVDQRSENLRIH